MIGKITTGKSFRGCIAYCLNDKIQQHNEQVMKDRAEVLLYNKCFVNEKEIVQQFNEVRQLNRKLKACFAYHPKPRSQRPITEE